MKKKKNFPENYWKQIYSNNAKQGGEEYQVSTWTKEGLDANIKYFLEYLESGDNKDDGKLVLDLGCGPGTFSRILSDKGFEVYGVDYSGEMVELARSNSTGYNIDYRAAEIYNLPFSENFFDKIICLGVFQVLETPVDAIREMKRILKPGGEIVVTTLNSFSFSVFLNLFIKREYSPQRFNPFHFKKLIENEGFKDVELKGIYFFPKKISFLTNFVYNYKIFKMFNKLYFVFNFLSNSFQIKAKKI